MKMVDILANVFLAMPNWMFHLVGLGHARDLHKDIAGGSLVLTKSLFKIVYMGVLFMQRH